MKKLILVLALTLALPLAPVGCTQAPSQRSATVMTLKIVGTTAKTAMDAATDLLKRGTITVPQWQKVALFYDTRWQPAFKLAVTTAQSDLSSVASPDLIALAAELTNLVAQLTSK